MEDIQDVAAQAMAHHRAGRFPEAEQLYRGILRVNPNDANAWHLLGLLAYQVGKPEIAVPYIGRAIELYPDAPDFFNHLALAFRALKRPDDALSCVRRALDLQPDFAEAHNNLGNLWIDQGKPDEAAACYRKAIELKPAFAEAHNNLGVILRQHGDFPAATACFQQAIRCRPDFADAHNNLSQALSDQSKLEQPGTVSPEDQQLRAKYAVGHCISGARFRREGKPEEAAANYERALTFQPDNAEAYYGLGNALADQGKIDEALACFDRALEVCPTDAIRYARAICLPAIYRSIEHVRDSRQRVVERVRELSSEPARFEASRHLLDTTFYLAYQGMNDREIHAMLGQLWSEGDPPPKRPPARQAARQGKIRVGLLSLFFREHTIGHLWRGVVAQLSREKFAVTVFVPPDASDAVTQFLRQHADGYRPLPPRVIDARQMIADEDLDVLVYLDIGMEPQAYCLAVSRLAPVQCATWGHPVTSGLPTIDYFLSSDLMEPADADSHYTEKLVRLKTLGLYLYRPAAPSQPKGRGDFGLPAGQHLYGCLQSLFKIHPEDDLLLGQILREDPQGELVLLEGTQPHWGKLLSERFASSIPDVADRIRFFPRQSLDDFLQLQATMDVLLDPIHFGGGRTSYEALALGLPVVTLPSPYLRGRITYGMCRRMGIEDCVARSADEYVRIALRLGTDVEHRRALRAKIATASGCLFEDREAVRELERFFEEAVLASGGTP